jgi:hypothetical protein
MIRPTEDDASPETRFIRYTEPGSVPLPNDGWMRSPKLKEHAICLEQGHAHFGWLMIEGWDGHWVACRRLTNGELVEMNKAITARNEATKLEIDRGK